MEENTGNIDKEELKGLSAPLKMFIEEMETYHDIVNVSMSGLSVTQAMPKVVDVIAKVEGESEAIETSRKNVNRIAKLAKNEIDNGFPFLHNQATLILYSQMEGTIKRFIIVFFGIDNILTRISQLSKIKISLAEYYNLSGVEQLEYLFQQYEKNVSIGMQYGVTRFEALLTPIGFGGEVDKDTRKGVFELSQIRNNLLHRGGIVDKHLLDSCPWLNFVIGDKVALNKNQYDMYFKSVMNYMILIIIRLGEKRGVDMSEFKNETIPNIISKALKRF